MSERKVMLANAVPAVRELRKVPGFDPLRLLQKSTDGEENVTLALRYKRLWFRLACPTGRLLLNPLRVTDQMAIYEAKVFLDKEDPLPIANYTVTKENGGSGSHYIQEAQDEALETALDNAGFGIQLCEMSEDVVTNPQRESTAVPTPEEEVKPTPPQDAPAPPESTEPPVAPAAPAEADAVSAPPVQGAEETQEPTRVPVTPAAPVQMAGVTAPPAQEAQPLHEPAPVPGAALTPTGENTGTRAITGGENPAEEPAPTEAEAQPKYTEDMSVEDICQSMTVEEAGKVVVTFGICNGWTIEQVAEQRSASLKWYAYGDQANNILKAAALVMLSVKDQQKAG